MIIKLLLLGSRITSIFNFGYVSLNIMHLRVEDAGSYTVRAVNRLGEAISSATLRVFGKSQFHLTLMDSLLSISPSDIKDSFLENVVQREQA